MGGYGWSDRVTILGVATTGADIKGGFGGGTVGFNYQAPGSMFVFGVEVDAAWSDINHTETIVGLGVAKERIKPAESALPSTPCCSTPRAVTPGRKTNLARPRLV